jgi:hypothetical protein
MPSFDRTLSSISIAVICISSNPVSYTPQKLLAAEGFQGDPKSVFATPIGSIANFSLSPLSFSTPLSLNK